MNYIFGRLSRRIFAIGVLVLLLVGAVLPVSSQGGTQKVDVCHFDADTGTYHRINISEKAFPTHVEHGDASPGDPVPGMEGYEFAADCSLVSVGPCPGGILVAASDTARLISAINDTNIAGGGTICLTPSTYTLTTVVDTTGGPNGLPSVMTSITILGNGATIMRYGAAPKFRIMYVAASGNLDLHNLTLTGGDTNGVGVCPNACGGSIFNWGTLTITGSAISNNLGYAAGGIDNNGNLIINTSTLSGNRSNPGVSAGGIFNRPGSTLSISNTTFVNNTGHPGGAISNSGTATIINSVISNNSSIANGGGIQNNGTGTMTISNSVISGNSASGIIPCCSGGGIHNNGGTMNLMNGTSIHSNTAILSGGGVWNASGGILNTDGTISITNNTADVDNTGGAGQDGGGIKGILSSGSPAQVTGNWRGTCPACVPDDITP